MYTRILAVFVLVIFMGCEKSNLPDYTQVERLGGPWTVISYLGADGKEKLGERDYDQGEIRFEFVNENSGNFLHSYLYFNTPTTTQHWEAKIEGKFDITEDQMSFDGTEIVGNSAKFYFTEAGMLHLKNEAVEFILSEKE